jgi:hypothetical protein
MTNGAIWCAGHCVKFSPKSTMDPCRVEVNKCDATLPAEKATMMSRDGSRAAGVTVQGPIKEDFFDSLCGPIGRCCPSSTLRRLTNSVEMRPICVALLSK